MEMTHSRFEAPSLPHQVGCLLRQRRRRRRNPVPRRRRARVPPPVNAVCTIGD
jgi:hypothetical protein